MAKKIRTKEQKRKSKERVSQTLTSTTFSFTDEEFESSDSTQKKVSNKAANHALWMYDPHLIVKDLRRTIFISLVLIALLLGVYAVWITGAISL